MFTRTRLRALTTTVATTAAAAAALTLTSTSAHAAAPAADTQNTARTATTHAGNLDGWIKEALAVMKAKGIPGTYEGLHRNIMR
ncbi:transglycosylase SLT domain-containing protein, partial [Streptomyces sp. NPDC001732]